MSEQTEAEIIAVKELRRDTDAIIQRVKALPPSRERALTITKLQEGVMWLGMDLKRINEQDPQPCSPPKTLRQCAEEAYARYGAVTDFKNFRGDPMPAFADLGEKIQAAWEAAVNVAECANLNPYPNSKDPSNTKIDPTADGLKL
jgi:hypothetical protein